MMTSVVVNETISNQSNKKMLAVFGLRICFVDITEVSFLGDPRKSKGSKG